MNYHVVLKPFEVLVISTEISYRDVFILLIIALLVFLVVQNLNNKHRLRKLVNALKNNDRTLLTKGSDLSAGSILNDLENQIIEQIFED